MISWLVLGAEIGVLVGFVAGVLIARPRQPRRYTPPTATADTTERTYTARCRRCDWARHGHDRDVLEQQLIEHHRNHHREVTA